MCGVLGVQEVVGSNPAVPTMLQWHRIHIALKLYT